MRGTPHGMAIHSPMGHGLGFYNRIHKCRLKIPKLNFMHKHHIHSLNFMHEHHIHSLNITIRNIRNLFDPYFALWKCHKQITRHGRHKEGLDHIQTDGVSGPTLFVRQCARYHDMSPLWSFNHVPISGLASHGFSIHLPLGGSC